MSFARGTTPTLSIVFSQEKYPTLDLTRAQNVIVTVVSGLKKVSKTIDQLDVSERQIDVYLTQTDTLDFGKTAKVQANWLDPDGKRLATVVRDVPVGEQLYERVMSNE